MVLVLEFLMWCRGFTNWKEWIQFKAHFPKTRTIDDQWTNLSGFYIPTTINWHLIMQQQSTYEFSLPLIEEGESNHKQLQDNFIINFLRDFLKTQTSNCSLNNSPSGFGANGHFELIKRVPLLPEKSCDRDAFPRFPHFDFRAEFSASSTFQLRLEEWCAENAWCCSIVWCQNGQFGQVLTPILRARWCRETLPSAPTSSPSFDAESLLRFDAETGTCRFSRLEDDDQFREFICFPAELDDTTWLKCRAEWSRGTYWRMLSN